MSSVVRKPALCICENKDADQLRGNHREADQHLCFRYKDSTIPLLSKSEILSLKPSSVAVQPVCVGPGRKPECWFSHGTAPMKYVGSKQKFADWNSKTESWTAQTGSLICTFVVFMCIKHVSS